MLSPSLIHRFFTDIYRVLKDVDRNTLEVWQEINQIPTLKKISNQIELENFLDNFTFIAIEDGNYKKKHYISIHKIQYICESMKYISLDIKKLSDLLDYSGFEALVQEILLRHGFHALKNIRFSDNSTFKSQTKQKKYEVDVTAIKNRYMLIIDCKQWRKKDSFSAINKAANLQLRRTKALKMNKEFLSDLIQKMIGLNHRIKLPLIMIPMMITLEDNAARLNDNNVPVVSIYHLNAFLQELRNNIDEFKIIKIEKLIIQKQLV